MSNAKRTLDTLHLTLYTIKKKVSCQLSSIRRAQDDPEFTEGSVVSCSSGFSLIELMVVISLFGIAASLITASYLSFEKNQRIKGAASQLKSDLRLVQNNATSGNHGVNVGGYIEGGASNSYCPVDSVHSAGGWYLLVNSTSGSSTYYMIGGDCINGANETVFAQKTINLPSDIKINRIFYDYGNISQPMAIFFRPLSNITSFHNGGASFPGFFQPDGVSLDNTLPPGPQDAVTVELINSTGKTSKVKIEPTGEVNEVNN